MGSRQLLCMTDLRNISFDWENSLDKAGYSYGAEHLFYLSLAWYGLRWNIEVSYYEGKTFWFLEKYQVFSREVIELLSSDQSVL